jgi:hypothetical protein
MSLSKALEGVRALLVDLEGTVYEAGSRVKPDAVVASLAEVPALLR